MKRGWRWPMGRGLTFVVLLLTVPRCTCGGGGGCASEPSCDFSFYNPIPSGEYPCDAQVLPGTHSVQTVSGCGGGCVLECSPGFSDCDHDFQNGCETQGECTSQSDSPFELADALPPTALLATLSGSPRGIAPCSTKLYYFDDDELMSDGAMITKSPGIPSGGLACAGGHLYWATLSDGDGSVANGAVWDFDLGTQQLLPLAAPLDPGRGIDVRASTAYVLARHDGGTMLATIAGIDAGVTLVMPADELPTYKSFALANDGDYALAGGALWFNPIAGDAGPTIVSDAAALAALVAPDSVGLFGVANAGDAATIAEIDDAGTSLFTATGPVVATSAHGTKIVVATDDTITIIDVAANKQVVVTETFLHIAYVATDGTHAYWLTRGEGSTPGAVWSFAPP